jgi:hypothetical protein
MGDMAFNAIIVILSSAFMMTLYRKRIIRGRTHMVVYTLCLVLSATHVVRSLSLTYTALTVGAFLLRIQLPRAISNKYVVWSAFLCVVYYPYLQTLCLQVYEKIAAAGELSTAIHGIPALMGEFPVVGGATTAAALYIAFQI